MCGIILAKSTKTSAKGARLYFRNLFTMWCTLVLLDNMTNAIRYSEPPEYLDTIGNKIVDAAFHVHKKWGPGLFEHFYQKALIKELKKMGLNVQREVYLPIQLDDTMVEDSYKLDLLVENEVIVELKSVEKLTPIHYQQIRTYLKVSNKRLGYLINFNTALIMDGIHRQIMSPN